MKTNIKTKSYGFYHRFSPWVLLGYEGLMFLDIATAPQNLKN
ncbi:hypothetical protein [Streptococcus thoraltensis]|nr:hypothetical protein [Streptococcus thoraltensis]